MISEKQRVLDWLYRTEFDSKQLVFDDLLLAAATEALGKPVLDAEAFAQQNSLKYWNWLKRQLEQDGKRGLYPVFTIADDLARKVRWHASDTGSAKQRRKIDLCRSRASILQKIDALTDREYEALGCVVSLLTGAENVLLTSKGSEKGIDFFASIVFPGRSHIFFGHRQPVRIIGQCKKYADRVKEEKIKEFITTLGWVKNRNPNVDPLVPPWFRTASGPILGWIIAHRGFQTGADTTARDFGIFLSDSRDLAEISALSRRVPEFVPANLRANHLYDEVVLALGKST